jgi:hypothetical protein
MLRRIFPLITLLFMVSSPLFAAQNYPDRASAIRSQFVHRKMVNTPRHDPRLHYIHSAKANSCMAGIGTCTLTTPDEGPVPSRYKNAVREKEAERRKKIRPWL